ncbi:LacI family DNA-binding transcriptional regulator [Quadrisphaera granulorum]|uniref:LacI family DNA-binding transcriptional regulator n=1 Tax=Quadrisphaera granulorum TaxID=317664 RepID=UPI001B861178|nr:LacI family DNA-binding transcriptional regulator [Quadrisphaera granulorum]
MRDTGQGDAGHGDAKAPGAGASGAPAPKPTLKAVAARAGVSTSTASLTFAGDPRVLPGTRARVLAAAAELGYAGPDPLARSLRRGRSRVVGVVVGDRLGYAFADPLAVVQLDALADEVGALGAGLLLIGGVEDDAARLAIVEQTPLDAVVFATCGGDDDPALDLLLRRRVPVVGIEGPYRAGVHLIDLDNRGATRAVGQHLAELGHTRVAVVALPWGPQRRSGWLEGTRRAERGYNDAWERLAGTEDVLRGDGAGPLPAWETATNSRQEGERAARALLCDARGELLPAARRPTAVVAQSDLLAVGVVTTARALGLRVPGELSVTGYDGVETPWLGADRLTTVHQPAAERGRAAGRMVAELLAGGLPEPIQLPVQLVIGTTTADAPLA